MEFLYATVVDNNDPLKIGRVKICIKGEHSENITTDMQESLPWAEVMQSASIGLVGGIGLSSVLKIGTWVYCTRLSSNDERYLVLGVCTGIQGEDGNDIKYGAKGLSDFGQMCTNNDTLKNSAFDESTSTSYGTSFNYSNDVSPMDYTKSTLLRTECGIMVDLNDSTESIKITHPSGSVIHIGKNGNIEITSLNDLTLNTKGSVNINAKEDFNLNVDGDLNVNVRGDVSRNVDGSCTDCILGSLDTRVQKDISNYANSNISYNVKEKVNYKVDTMNYEVKNDVQTSCKNFNTSASDGLITNVNIITPRGIDLDTHVHSGVRRGDSNTDMPE